jgi:hypothetical protein
VYSGRGLSVSQVAITGVYGSQGGAGCNRRIVFDDEGTTKTFLPFIREKNAAQGKPPAAHADKLLGMGPDVPNRRLKGACPRSFSGERSDGRSGGLEQARIFSVGVLQDRDVGVSISPKGAKILVGNHRLVYISRDNQRPA